MNTEQIAIERHDAVYVLTNKAMPNMVKIGFTSQADVKMRIAELYTTGVPLPFNIEWVCRTKNAAEAEKALHKAFKHNRVNESREFFSIEPEQAIGILKLLNSENITSEVEKQPTPIDPQSIAAEKKFKPKRPNLDFEKIGVPIGSTLQSTKDSAFSVTVVAAKKVKIGNEEMSLTEATRRAMKLAAGYPIQPAPHWKFNGQLLQDLYEKTYPAADE
jgi:Meiotically Up-regulated Gene 113 (MUG113) protein